MLTHTHGRLRKWASCATLMTMLIHTHHNAIHTWQVAQVVELVKTARGRSLQEGVQLLIALEEDDLPQLFVICRDIMRSVDQPDAAPAQTVSRTSAVAPTAWRHTLEEDNDGAFASQEVPTDASSWAAAKCLKRARLQLMQGRAIEAIAALEKLRLDFVAFARDTSP